MATVPRSKTRVQVQATAAASGLDLVCVIAPCPKNADGKPIIFGSAEAAYENNGYCAGIEYASLHVEETDKSFMLVPVPIITPGVIGRHDTSGNTGTATSTVTAGADGNLAENDGVLSVVKGGTVGTDQIVLGLSLDGGRLTKNIRFGTGNSYTVPYFELVIALGAGTLTEGDIIHTWHGTEPLTDSTNIQAARENLASQQDGFRSILLIGDLQTSDDATAFVTELNAYETENDRFTYGRAGVRDRLPQAAASRAQVRMQGNPSLTFLEVGATGDTITRSAGSWIADGFVIGDIVTVAGSAGNNVTGPIAGLSATVLTFGTTDLVNEGPVAGCSVVGSGSLTFAEVGATGDTITRSRGSWLADGFRVGDVVSITGTASNNVSGAIAALTATVLTFGTTDLNAEVISSFLVTITAGETKAAWMAAVAAEFEDIDDEFRIDLSAGRGRIASPFSEWIMRRPAFWFASVREYQHDLQIPNWRKSDGPTGAILFDQKKQLVEWDDDADGGAGSANRFTTLRTYSNGPAYGAFITQSLTRGDENTVLAFTHNVAVLNLCCAVTQNQTENSCIGRTGNLNEDGTLTSDALSAIAREVNKALSQNLLIDAKGEGQRSSFAKYTPSTDDPFNVPEATLTGVVELELEGTIHDTDTAVSVS